MNEYVGQQLRKLGEVKYGQPIQLKLSNDNGRTNTMYLTFEQYEKIAAILKDDDGI